MTCGGGGGGGSPALPWAGLDDLCYCFNELPLTRIGQVIHVATEGAGQRGGPL